VDIICDAFEVSWNLLDGGPLLCSPILLTIEHTSE